VQRRSQEDVKQGVLDCVGNTPLVRIKSLSDATGCDILAKAEFLNPGGSIKDRIALHMVRKAAASGRLTPGALITEATAGSTGVSLAMVAAACGYKYVSLHEYGYHLFIQAILA
jgi:cysteine synthase